MTGIDRPTVTSVRETSRAVPVVDEARQGPRRGFRARLAEPGIRPWYLGAGIGLLWQSSLVAAVALSGIGLVRMVFGFVILAVLYGAFFVLGPLLRGEPLRRKVGVMLGYWAVSCVLFPIIGIDTIWLWILVTALAVFAGLPLRWSIGMSGAVIAAQLAIVAGDGFSIDIIFAPFVTLAVAASMVAGLALGRSSRSLRLANTEIARLAVIEERARFGRDLHDVLGHSLTVVTVKAELARRLVRIDPTKAEAELADIERLTRGALADLRLAVSDSRETSLDAELRSAATALAAAGIRAQLPDDPDLLSARLQPTFAWVVREGVTNVIRHSGATECRITVGPDRLTVTDDGRGPDARERVGAGDGHGLRGLRERLAVVDAELVVAPGDNGGFELTARAIGVDA